MTKELHSTIQGVIIQGTNNYTALLLMVAIAIGISVIIVLSVVIAVLVIFSILLDSFVCDRTVADDEETEITDTDQEGRDDGHSRGIREIMEPAEPDLSNRKEDKIDRLNNIKYCSYCADKLEEEALQFVKVEETSENDSDNDLVRCIYVYKCGSCGRINDRVSEI